MLSRKNSKVFAEDHHEMKIAATETTTSHSSSSNKVAIHHRQAGSSVWRMPRSSIELGRILGKGGFCTVYKVKQFHNVDASSSNHEQDELYGPPPVLSVWGHDLLVPTDQHEYAVKVLSDVTLRNPRRCRTGAKDLEYEARLLASLNHPNIIKLRGVSSDASGDQFFLLLDLLHSTLDKRLRVWKEYSKQRLTRLYMPLSLRRNRQLFLCERLTVALDLASALQYLHQHHIMFRDLKPENCGLTVDGDVQLFDFGLAKHLDTWSADDVYKLSAETGSRRYMAPEVALCRRYNYKVDVYSFGLLLWQVLALSSPFNDILTKTAHLRHVAIGNQRPPVDPKWPGALKDLVQRCWDSNAKKRPTMDECVEILTREIETLKEKANMPPLLDSSLSRSNSRNNS